MSSSQVKYMDSSGMEPYPEYKDSGIEWIGKIPEHWDILKVKTIFNLIKKPNFENEPTLLSLTQQGIYVRDITTFEGQIAQTYAGYNTIKIGDICLNPMDLKSGAAAISKYNGIISNAYFTIKEKDKKNTLNEFFAYYFDMHYKYGIFYPFGTGVGRPEGRGGRWTLSKKTFLNFPLISPPLNEQQAIATFLDRETTRIDALVEKKQQFIELLEERRSSLISHAVTKGLDPDVPMKDSGIEWIGQIPEHWDFKKLSYMASLKSGENITSTEFEKYGEYPVFGGNGLRGYFSKYTHEGEYVIIGRQGALCGNINYTKGKCWVSEHAIVVNPTTKFVTFWMGELLKAMNLNRYSISAAQPGISVENIKKLKIPVPPLQEQQAIANYLDRETSQIDTLIEKTEQSIEYLKEYRTALISSAVTGKIDVRGTVSD
ncbi:MAG: type I restriction-modification system S(specificity) subunit [Methanohalophilus sp. T328-1]|nr:MAG: type I restriction-modification system S(specificity) subunit [Methanohalophilus sp. T328-1]